MGIGTESDMGRHFLIGDTLTSIPSYCDIQRLLINLNDCEFYVAGGAIRNILSGLSDVINDIDIFVFFEKENLQSYQRFISALSKIGLIKYGQYGSPRWYPSKDDKLYYDIVPYSNFNVGFGNPKTIKEALEQFDFTANAVAYNMLTHNICNPVGGIEDIRARIFRAVRFDFPDGIISESVPISRLSALWFRFVHYASKLDFKIEEKTLRWINENSFRINDIKIFEKYFFKPLISTQVLLQL